MYYLIAAILLVLLIILWGRFFEWSNLYFPDKHIVTTPASIGMEYEDVYFTTSDGVKLNGWFLPPRGEAKSTIIYCHGNAGNISHRLEILKMLNSLGVNVLIFDYRGYGKSKGIPSEKGTYLDALAAYEYISARPDVDMSKIAVFGKSLGGTVAADLATNADVSAVILDSAFTSTSDMAKEIYPSLPIGSFLSIKYDTLSKVGNLDMPKLIIHSEDDEIVPFAHGERIFAASSQPKEFYRARGGHNEGIIIYIDQYQDRLEEFLRKNGM